MEVINQPGYSVFVTSTRQHRENRFEDHLGRISDIPVCVTSLGCTSLRALGTKKHQRGQWEVKQEMPELTEVFRMLPIISLMEFVFFCNKSTFIKAVKTVVNVF